MTGRRATATHAARGASSRPVPRDLEPSLGITPFWELGAYLQGAVRTDDGVVDWAGVGAPSKFVTPPSWNPHWRLGVNFEVSYLPPTYDHDRWGSEIRPIVAWHDARWLFVFNPILDLAFAGSDASQGPSFQPALKVARTVGPWRSASSTTRRSAPSRRSCRGASRSSRSSRWSTSSRSSDSEVNFGVGEGLTSRATGSWSRPIVGTSSARESKSWSCPTEGTQSAWRGRDCRFASVRERRRDPRRRARKRHWDARQYEPRAGKR